MKHSAEIWMDYSEALAFAGNSLLAPMSQTSTAGLDPTFWGSFPDFDDGAVAAALAALSEYADSAQSAAEAGGNPVQDASVEYTRLFVGPPRPEAAPWETMYSGGSEVVTVGFGQATFEMRELLRGAGLEVSNENNQYADHVGIELLYASVLCRRASDAALAGDRLAEADAVDDLAVFVQDRLLQWLPKLQAAIDAAAAGGYFARIVRLAIALLHSL